MNIFKSYCKKSIIYLLFGSLFFTMGCSQKPEKWEEIHLWDLGEKQDYIAYSVSGLSPKETDLETHQYTPANLFDADFHTCFVCCQAKEISKNALFLKLSKNRNAILNIFSGYGKSKTLYTENARPKKLKFSIYAAINPEAHVSELGVMYKAIKFPKEQIVELPDIFGVKSIPLNFDQNDLSDFLNKVNETYDADFEIPKAESCLILKIEIEEIYKGSKYEDVCISEFFFNDCFITNNPVKLNEITKVYINKNENTLLLDEADKKGVVVFTDKTAILQFIAISKDKKWAILLAMPSEVQGRVATSYLLVDLINKEVVNTKLEKSTGNYLSGNEMYFSSAEKGATYLKYLAKDGAYYRLELK